MSYASFAKKFDQSFTKLKADMTPVLKALYKQAVDGYVNLHKRGTILLKAFCHNAVNICMGLSLKSFAAITLLPVVLLLATVDLSSRGERDARQMKDVIAAQLQNTRNNTQTTHAGIDMQHQQKTDKAAAAAAQQLAGGASRIAPPILSSEAFLAFTQETQTARDAAAYLEEARKAAKIEPAAGR
ncbi:MAG: hypothetical protein Q8K65_05320 [Alphaproteobacteria bacterium]|nr:hypothetical protein [Alphaproteobacteria bacterium]